MSYPTQSDFVAADPLLAWIDDEFLRLDPFAFRDSDFRAIVRTVSSSLEVDPNGVYVLGSGAIGLSFNPKNIAGTELAPFDRESDIDLAIISEVFFEAAWRDLRRATQPTLDEMGELLEKNLGWQKKRFFDGAILANVLLPALSFGRQWATALVVVEQSMRMSRSPWNFGGGLLSELSQMVEAATSGAGVSMLVWRAISRSTATASAGSLG